MKQKFTQEVSQRIREQFPDVESVQVSHDAAGNLFCDILTKEQRWRYCARTQAFTKLPPAFKK